VKYRGALLLLPALAAASAAHAETLYVVEQLVVNVNSAPDSTGERIATIKSGDALEVLDRQGDQVHVHLTNGTEGWVRKSYLSADEPLHVKLSERTAEVEKLKQDVTRLEGELAAASSQTRASASASAPPPGAEEPAAAEQPAHEPPYFMTPPDSPTRPVWHWALGSFVVALGLGFLLGWQVLDRRIRRKYGGLRIY
jgi:Bacterial SH3 domain